MALRERHPLKRRGARRLTAALVAWYHQASAFHNNRPRYNTIKLPAGIINLARGYFHRQNGVIISNFQLNSSLVRRLYLNSKKAQH